MLKNDCIGEDVVRDFSKWGGVQAFDSISDFEEYDKHLSGVCSIKAGLALVDIHVDIIDGAPLLVYFNGSQNRGEGYSLPFFSGFNVTPLGKASRLSINDPGLYLSSDASMCWYAGSKYFDLQNDIIPRLIKKVFSLANSTFIVFVGGSAGGFASLLYSSKFPGSFCLTSNPQTDIFKYYYPHVNRYLNSCWAVDSIGEAKAQCGVFGDSQQDVYGCYKGDFNNTVIYLQNINDPHHVKNHFSPFLESISLVPPSTKGVHQLSHNFLVYLGDWGEGHVTAPKSFWRNLLSILVKEENISAEALESL